VISSTVAFAIASKPSTLNWFIEANTPTPRAGAKATKLNYYGKGRRGNVSAR
jgi:hypothetical protein